MVSSSFSGKIELDATPVSCLTTFFC
jgi:hypothetical protein